MESPDPFTLLAIQAGEGGGEQVSEEAGEQARTEEIGVGAAGRPPPKRG